MNTLPRSPSTSGTPQNPGNLSDLGYGAIAAPMAVSFREEKLALRMTGQTTAPQSGSTPRQTARRDHG